MLVYANRGNINHQLDLTPPNISLLHDTISTCDNIWHVSSIKFKMSMKLNAKAPNSEFDEEADKRDILQLAEVQGIRIALSAFTSIPTLRVKVYKMTV